MRKIITVFACIAAGGAAQGETIKETMGFDQCLETIRLVATKSGVVPVNIVETEGVRVVRMPAPDGSLLVTCNRAQRLMIMQPSTKVCGRDVVC